MPPGVRWTETQGGFSLLVTLPEGMNAAALSERALERGVAFTPGQGVLRGRRGEGMLRLSFSALPVGQIDEGVQRLAEAIREAARQPERAARDRQHAVPLV